MPNINFINNVKTLELCKIDYTGAILNGYDSVNNILRYNDNSNIIRDLLHVASSTRSPYQGICVTPNLVFKESIGYAFNEGITDMFLDINTNVDNYFPFEKICAKVFKFAYGTKPFSFYFLGNDSAFRHQFNKDITRFMIDLDEYSSKMILVKRIYDTRGEIEPGMEYAIKILMDIVIKDLLKIVSDSDKDCKTYLINQLKSKSMRTIYKIIGKYEVNI